MLKTIADDIWGQPCLAFHVQPHLTAETQASLGELQKAIAAHWPHPLHTAPPEALHQTLYALANVKDRFDKEAYWRSVAEPCGAILESLCRGHTPLELHFSRLKVTDTAIIAVATEPSGLIETIRHRIAELIPPPVGLKPMRYNLIHSTLARYQISAEIPDEIVATIESLPVSVKARVESIKLVRETLFPCQKHDELRSFPLI
ncbi:MAG: 2'-5' RNA ligase family protein [Microvirga sp.]